MTKHFLFIISMACLTCSCVNKKSGSTEDYVPARISYANGFSIDYASDHTLVTVRNPWDTAKILHRYILVDKEKPLPRNLPEGDLVRVPVDGIACLSSTDASVIEMLGDIYKLKAMGETKYVKMPVLRKGLDEGTIADIGEYSAIHVERLLEVSPDIIIVSPYQNMGYGKLETTGIGIVECASYMEDTPLGRAEWIRFIAAFLKKDKEAEAITRQTAEKYFALREKAAGVTFRPTVFSEKMYSSVWYVPGGNSYMAHFFADSGADYIWKDDEHSGSLTLNFEMVYDKAENADYWLIRTDKNISYRQLEEEYERYSWFKAWKERKIILSNTVLNNYYEEGVMYPHRVLSDLIRIFHPEIDLPQDSSHYFDLIKE